MKTTILVEKATRELLKQLGNKGQSYDDLINLLIINKNPKIRPARDRDSEVLFSQGTSMNERQIQ